MIARPAFHACFFLLSAGLAGCGGEDARVVVGLTTDMAVGFDIRHIETTTRVDGAVVDTGSQSYTSGDLALPAELPFPPAHDGAEVELTIEAFRDGEASPVVTRAAATRAESGLTLLLPVSLDAACSAVTCTGGSTCAGGACADPFLAPSTLSEYDPAWITSAPDACKSPSSGDPVVEIGKGQGAFASLEYGETVPIEPGPQGGHHLWLALRVSGVRQMGSRLTLSGSYPELDVELGPVTSMVTLRKAGDDRCEIYGIRFQVDHGLPVEAIHGQALDVAIDLEDPDGDGATAATQLVISP